MSHRPFKLRHGVKVQKELAVWFASTVRRTSSSYRLAVLARCAFLRQRAHRLIGALSALEHRLFVGDERSLLPTHGAFTFRAAVPDRLGGVDNSDDRRCLVLFAAPEEEVQVLQPSGAAAEPRALHERATRSRVPCKLLPSVYVRACVRACMRMR